MEENKDTWRNLPAPQTQDSTRQAYVFRGNSASSTKESKPPLSSIISLAAVGAMAVIAAIGLWIMMAALGSEDLATAGRAVLVATGLIVLITGGVLGYAGWNGLRPGWFLWFSIVGAAMLGPVVLGGVGMLGTADYNEYEVASQEFEVLEEDFEDWDDEDGDLEDSGASLSGSAEQWEKMEQIHEELFDENGDSDVTWLDPTVTDIDLEGTEAALDLRDVAAGEDFDYQINLDSSTLQVVLGKNQLPLIESAQFVAPTRPGRDSTIDALAFTPSWEYGATATALSEWLDMDFEPEYYPLEGRVLQADNQFTFTLHLDDSEVNFILVEDQTEQTDGQADKDQRNADSKDSSSKTSSDAKDSQDGDDK